MASISASMAMDFCQLWHLQGMPHGVIAAYGGFLGDTLVGVVTMGMVRGGKEIELSRFCTDGPLYSGLFSRLVRMAARDFPSMVSFADLRYSDGGVYRNNGFELVAEIPPDYRYVRRGETFHKSNFTKSKIEDKFGIDMTGLTERSAMEGLGYSRIYDCGKLKFKWAS
jgi:hypothetical protein